MDALEYVKSLKYELFQPLCLQGDYIFYINRKCDYAQFAFIISVKNNLITSFEKCSTGGIKLIKHTLNIENIKNLITNINFH